MYNDGGYNAYREDRRVIDLLQRDFNKQIASNIPVESKSEKNIKTAALSILIGMVLCGVISLLGLTPKLIEYVDVLKTIEVFIITIFLGVALFNFIKFYKGLKTLESEITYNSIDRFIKFRGLLKTYKVDYTNKDDIDSLISQLKEEQNDDKLFTNFNIVTIGITALLTSVLTGLFSSGTQPGIKVFLTLVVEVSVVLFSIYIWYCYISYMVRKNSKNNYTNLLIRSLQDSYTFRELDLNDLTHLEKSIKGAEYGKTVRSNFPFIRKDIKSDEG